MKPTILAALVVMATAGTARADILDDAGVVGDALRANGHRFRRGLAVGPEVGGFLGYDLDGSRLLDGVSFGVGIYSFEVPTALDLKERILAEVKKRVKERLGDLLLGDSRGKDAKELVRQIVREVRAELVEEPPRHTLEPPRFGLVVEGAILTSTGGGFQTRLVASKGVSKASVGLALALQHAGGETRFVPGVEVDLRLTPIGLARTPVIELFARGDVTIADGYPLAIVGGGRFALDLL